MNEAELIYEFNFENENQRNDYGLICSECHAGIYCENIEQANYQRSINYYCYSCGARFINIGDKKHVAK